jgi:hypothetical protein
LFHNNEGSFRDNFLVLQNIGEKAVTNVDNFETLAEFVNLIHVMRFQNFDNFIKN